MAGGQVVVNDRKMRKLLKQISDRVGNIVDPSNAISSIFGTIVFQDIMDHFNRQSGPNGRWKPWSEIYARDMSRRGKGGNRILQDTGRLRQGVTPGNVRRSSRGLIWYNPVRTRHGFPYAVAHDEGGRKLPQREFMWLSGRALQKITQASLDYIEKGK